MYMRFYKSLLCRKENSSDGTHLIGTRWVSGGATGDMRQVRNRWTGGGATGHMRQVEEA